MQMRKALIGTLATAVVALGSAVVPAQAASAGAWAPTAGGTAPACILRSVDYTTRGFWVFLENTCPKTMRVQVIVDKDPNSSCMTLGSGETTAWYSYGTAGRYVRTAVC